MKRLDNSLHRIDAASREQFLREATRGEFEVGKYLRDMGTGAAGGAAAGGTVGAFAGGVGAAPGALAGAVGGAIWGVGTRAIDDIAYWLYGDDGKAAWQAGDLEDLMKKIGDILGKTNPQLGQTITQLGAMYKNYVDVAIRKKDDPELKKVFEQNIFNPASQGYSDNPFAQPAPQQVTSGNKKFVRVALETDNPYAAIGGSIAPSVPGGMAEDWMLRKLTNNPNATMFPSAPAGAAAGDKAKHLVKNVGKGIKGLGVGLVAEQGLNAGLDWVEGLIAGGDTGMLKQHIAEIEKIIVAVNGLTENDKSVVAAGNILWTYLQQIVETFKAAEQKMNQPLQQPQMPQQLPNQQMMRGSGRKFVRVKTSE